MNNSSRDHLILLVEMQRKAFRKYQLIPLSLVLVVGFLANIIVVYSGLKKKLRAKYTTNSFIVNLAAADLGVVLYFIPIQFVEYTIGLDVNDWVCKYIVPIRETFLIVSIFTVAELGMVRFLQFRSYRALSRRVTYSVIALTWVIGYLAISLPLSRVIKHTRAMTCDHIWEDKIQRKVHIGLLNLIQLIPLLITTICYASIIRKTKRLTNERCNAAGEEVSHNGQELRLLMSMLIFTAWWSFGPYLIICFLSLLEVQIESPLIAWSVMAVLMTSSSAINPILILLMHRDYFNEVKNSIYRKKKLVKVTAITTEISGLPGFTQEELKDVKN